MTDQELQRRVRGRVRKLRQRRRRLKLAAASAIVFAGLSIFASLSFNLVKQERVRVLEPVKRSYDFSFQTPVIAQAEPQPEAKKKSSLLNLDRLFPNFRKKQSDSRQVPPDDSKQADQERPDDVVILDDLSAAPPKTMYLEAIFQTSKSASRDPLPPIQLSIDYTRSVFEVTSGPTPSPVVPEPGTGVLLGLGLGGISIASRRRRHQLAAAGLSDR